MLNAKLLVGLAGTALVIAILGAVGALPHANLSLHVANIVFGPFFWQLFIALVCAVFGFAYFGAVHLMQRPLNQTTGLVGYSLIAFASAVWLISSFVSTARSPLSRWVVMLLFAGIFSFILGVALSAVNVAWVLLRKKASDIAAS